MQHMRAVPLYICDPTSHRGAAPELHKTLSISQETVTCCRDTTKEFMASMPQVYDRVLSCFAKGLGYPEDFFVAVCLPSHLPSCDSPWRNNPALHATGMHAPQKHCCDHTCGWPCLYLSSCDSSQRCKPILSAHASTATTIHVEGPALTALLTHAPHDNA